MARWLAAVRAEESERSDALFVDPYAGRLAGERGEELARRFSLGGGAWAFVVKTYLFDAIVREAVEAGVDLVVNLGAGLDARPYRLDLPPSLRWVEADRPRVLAHKEKVLAEEVPRCALERVELDALDPERRPPFLDGLAAGGSRGLVLCEGVLGRFSPEDVASLARDLAAVPALSRWALDLNSPGLTRMIQGQMGRAGRGRAEGDPPVRFAPEEGPDFFRPFGWEPVQVHSVYEVARKMGRVPIWMRAMAAAMGAGRAEGSGPWSGVVLLERRRA
jgi:methyltransferase (TIGR00027 family)